MLGVKKDKQDVIPVLVSYYATQEGSADHFPYPTVHVGRGTDIDSEGGRIKAQLS